MTLEVIEAPIGFLERSTAATLRFLMRCLIRTVVGPPFPIRVQRRAVRAVSRVFPVTFGLRRSWLKVNDVLVELDAPKSGALADEAILYIHGGAFCLGRPWTHRSITSFLVKHCRRTLWVPDYRLTPKYPYPAALDDLEAVYDEICRQGVPPEKVIIAGDSAGASLALALTLRLRRQQRPLPARLVLLSPVTDLTLSGVRSVPRPRIDPLIRPSWLEQAFQWYACPSDVAEHKPLETDLGGLPSILIQVGDQELLFQDSVKLAHWAEHCGVDCHLQIYRDRWHVFQLQSGLLRSSLSALHAIARFINTGELPRPTK